MFRELHSCAHGGAGVSTLCPASLPGVFLGNSYDLGNLSLLP